MSQTEFSPEARAALVSAVKKYVASVTAKPLCNQRQFYVDHSSGPPPLFEAAHRRGPGRPKKSVSQASAGRGRPRSTRSSSDGGGSSIILNDKDQLYLDQRLERWHRLGEDFPLSYKLAAHVAGQAISTIKGHVYSGGIQGTGIASVMYSEIQRYIREGDRKKTRRKVS